MNIPAEAIEGCRIFAPGRRGGIWIMRNSLWIILTLLVAIGAPSAHADTCPLGNTCTDYTITFTETTGSDPLPTGTVVFDSTTSSISSSIVWDGLSFAFEDSDLTASLLSPPILPLPASCLGATPAQEVLNTLEGCTGLPAAWNGLAPSNSGIAIFGLEILYPPSDTSFSDGESVLNLTDNSTQDAGILTISPTVATPEPGAGLLMLIGIGLVLVMRKSLAQGLQQAS